MNIKNERIEYKRTVISKERGTHERGTLIWRRLICTNVPSSRQPSLCC